VVDLDQITAFLIGEEVLAPTIDVVRDHTARTIENRLSGAVVDLQLHGFRIGIITLELHDVSDVGATPGVNGLIGVAHHAEISVLTRNLLHEFVLDAIGVLIFVDQHVLPAPLIVGEHIRKALEEFGGAEQQIPEIEGVAVDEQALVGGVDFGTGFGIEILRCLRRGRRIQTVVLPAVDPPLKPLGF